MVKGGSDGEPNLCTILPMALGQSLLVNYAVSCSICFVPGWQEAASARGTCNNVGCLDWEGGLIVVACECDIQEGP